MKKVLLDEGLNKYKANLHCHTVVSDGKLTPLEVKEAYKNAGYSVVAYTDHDIFVSHNYLNDDDFLALNGYEMEFYAPLNPERSSPTCHICLIQKDPNNMTQVCWHREKYLVGNGEKYKEQVVFDENEPDFVREHTPENITKAIKTAREKGFFVTYNHPTWSIENYEDYMNFHGMHAMEICNYSSMVEGFDEYNPRVYDDMLRGGERIYCIGADDNHNAFPLDSPASDSFGAFTVIYAKELSYKAIMDSLFAGNFYASQGPEIYSLTYEDGTVNIKCSDAERIFMSANGRKVQVKFGENAPLNEASFKVFEHNKYLRLTVVDKYGKYANTNAYFLDELNK